MRTQTTHRRPAAAQAMAVPLPLAPTPRGATGIGSAIDAAGALVGRLIARRRRKRAERRAMRELAVLSDHALKDLGLHRSEIGSIVHGGPDRFERQHYAEL